MYTLNRVEVHAVCFEPGILEREGGHIYMDKSGTIRAKPGDNQMTVAYGVDLYNQSITGDKAKCITSKASDADHIPCVCYGLDTYNQNAEEELMPTIRTNGGGDCIPKVAYGFDNYNLCLTGEVGKTLQAEGGGSGVNEGCVVIENHPNDSRVKLSKDNVVQALTSRMGTGGATCL